MCSGSVALGWPQHASLQNISNLLNTILHTLLWHTMPNLSSMLDICGTEMPIVSSAHWHIDLRNDTLWHGLVRNGRGHLHHFLLDPETGKSTICFSLRSRTNSNGMYCTALSSRGVAVVTWIIVSCICRAGMSAICSLSGKTSWSSALRLVCCAAKAHVQSISWFSPWSAAQRGPQSAILSAHCQRRNASSTGLSLEAHQQHRHRNAVKDKSQTNHTSFDLDEIPSWRKWPWMLEVHDCSAVVKTVTVGKLTGGVRRPSEEIWQQQQVFQCS